MMKRLVTLLALTVLPISANASTTLAAEWGDRASDLYVQTTRIIMEIDYGLTPEISDQYLLEIERFAMTASRLSAWEAQAGPAPQVACIFREMASESVNQLVVLDAAPSVQETREALGQLALVLMDAENVAEASIRPSVAPKVPDSCERALFQARYARF